MTSTMSDARKVSRKSGGESIAACFVPASIRAHSFNPTGMLSESPQSASRNLRSYRSSRPLAHRQKLLPLALQTASDGLLHLTSSVDWLSLVSRKVMAQRSALPSGRSDEIVCSATKRKLQKHRIKSRCDNKRTENNAILLRLSERGRIKPVGGGRTIVQELDYTENSTFTRYTGLTLAPLYI